MTKADLVNEIAINTGYDNYQQGIESNAPLEGLEL